MHRAPILIAALAACLLTAGCTIVPIEGQGASRRPEVAGALHDLTPEKAAEWKTSILTDARAERQHRGLDSSGYDILGRAPVPWPVLVGSSYFDRHFEPQFATGKRELMSRADWRGLLSPLVFTWARNDIHEVATGRGVASRDLLSITPLISWASSTDPGGGFLELPEDATPANVSLDAIDYHEQSGLYLVGGLVGFGARDGTAFLQLLWIQIPFWNTR